MEAQQETRSFNLLKEPWIPVADVGEVSLMDIFKYPKKYRRLGGNAVEKVVILRLLLCVAHACCKVRDEKDWKKLTLEQLATNAQAYLKKWQDRFDLYDAEHPFLQSPQLKGKCKAYPMYVIAIQAGNTNKPILTQWQQANFTSAEVARMLLAGTAYNCGGKRGDLSVQINPLRKKKEKYQQCALMGSNGYLHSFMLGETLLETIWLNMLTEEELFALNPFDKTDIMGRPFWESMPVDESDNREEKYQKSYQGILFPLSKYLCLDGDSLLMTEGIFYFTHNTGQWDPGITLFKEEKGFRALWCDTKEKPWRQLPALMRFMVADKSDEKASAFLKEGFPRFVKGVKEFSRKNEASFGVWIGGVAVKNKSGEQVVSGPNDYVDSEFFIPIAWKNDISFSQYKTLMETVEKLANQLYRKVSGYYSVLGLDRKDSGKIASSAVQQYWERMEPLAQEIIDLSVTLVKESHKERYKALKLDETRKWQQIANACYEQFCPHVTPRQIQAFVHPFKERASDENAKDSTSSQKTRGTKGTKS